ncbi:hypothetical protein HDU82_007895 [Entophlyctis luteolus]|nr:hypothetical protein HDU82_007895 [Entophlyctis luteolus]
MTCDLILESSSGLSSLSAPPKAPSNEPCILVAGGAGYIGSNTVLEILLQVGAQWNVIVVDNLSTSTTAAKSVPESWENPLAYYTLNLNSTINLLSLATDAKWNPERRHIHFVFSSSACTYGASLDDHEYDFSSPGGSGALGVSESCPLKPINPYGRTKVFNEEIIRDCSKLHSDESKGIVLKSAILRYFNPVGAHSSGFMGECLPPGMEPPNLVPIVTRFAARRARAIATGSRPPTAFKVFGVWPTPDASPIRDFLHITDLAKSHVAALRKLALLDPPQNTATTPVDWNCLTYNVGCGRGFSVREIVKTVEKVSGIEIPIEVVDRREGDAGIAISDPSKAWNELGWKTEMVKE